MVRQQSTRRAQVSFDATKAEQALISAIVKRGMKKAEEAGRRDIKAMDLSMDITACHANGCPLRLRELLNADDFNFVHDVFGINRHIDRDTGQMMNCFLPRFHAARVAA